MYHDEQVAGAIVQEWCGEGEIVSTRGAVEAANIDWSECRRIIRHKTRREVGGRDIGQIYGAVGLCGRCRGVAILEFDARDGGGATQLRGKNQLLGIAVIIVIANREVVGGRRPCASIEGQHGGSGGVALDAGERVGTEYQGITPCTIAVGTTVGTYNDGVLGAEGESGEEHTCSIDCGKSKGTGTRIGGRGFYLIAYRHTRYTLLGSPGNEGTGGAYGIE